MYPALGGERRERSIRPSQAPECAGAQATNTKEWATVKEFFSLDSV